jgi:hypothetical protein
VAHCIARLLRDDFRVELAPSVPSRGIAELRQVLDHWIHGQQAFFTRAAKRDEKRLTRTEHTTICCFAWESSAPLPWSSRITRRKS